MALLSVKVFMHGTSYIIQDKGTTAIREALDDLCQHRLQRYRRQRVIICDKKNRQVNEGVLLRWVHDQELYLSVHQGRKRRIGTSRTYVANNISGEAHLYFYITFSRGTRRMFLNKWSPKSHTLRIDCMAGESFTTSLRRDGRLDLWCVTNFTLVHENKNTHDITHYLPSFTTVPNITGRTFVITRAKKQF
jgi:hypothetical protein